MVGKELRGWFCHENMNPALDGVHADGIMGT